MENKKTAVFCTFLTSAQAEQAVDGLVLAGFPSGDISVLLRDYGETGDTPQHEVGGALGILAGIGVITIPGLGPFIAAGPITAGPEELGADGIVGALTGFGLPENEAKRYEGRLKSGHALLSVHLNSADAINRARQILKTAGADDLVSAEQTEKARTSGSS